jgi:Family of unknown function (DUF5995)
VSPEIAQDQNLLQILAVTPPASIDEVIQRMKSLDDAIPANDGLKWFNLLYLMVTQEVGNNPPQSEFQDLPWVNRLDVIFANLYFTAISDFLRGSPVASSWQALFEARQRAGIDRIQLALAGMNAHINHDLSLALLQIEAKVNMGFNPSTPEHNDYEQVNGLLETVLPQALQFLATGILGEIAQDTGKIGRLLAIWNVRVARDLAWDFAEHVRGLTGLSLAIALRSQDKLTGTIGRILLVPIK